MKIARLFAHRVELPLHEGSTPEEFRFTSTDLNSYVTVSTAEWAPKRDNGFMMASAAPGFGVTLKQGVIGCRILEVV